MKFCKYFLQLIFFVDFCIFLEIDQLCLGYDEYNTNCLSCNKGYINNGKCQKSIEVWNCLKYLEKQKCIECDFGYYLYGNECH